MITRCKPLLGTFVEISAPAKAADAINAAFATIGHIQARMSFHEETSDLASIRRAGPGDIVEVDPETMSVLRLALSFYEATGGLFDVAIGRELVRHGFLPRTGIDDLAHYSGF